MESFFQYVQDIDPEANSEVQRMAKEAALIFGVTELENGRAVATQIRTIVDNILDTGKYPVQYPDLVDVAVGLGCLYGNALCTGYGWQWKDYGDEDQDHAYHGVVSPKGYFSHAPMEYMYTILTGNNIGLDGRNDNTVLLLYNMLENIDENPKDKMYVPLA